MRSFFRTLGFVKLGLTPWLHHFALLAGLTFLVLGSTQCGRSGADKAENGNGAVTPPPVAPAPPGTDPIIPVGAAEAQQLASLIRAHRSGQGLSTTAPTAFPLINTVAQQLADFNATSNTPNNTLLPPVPPGQPVTGVLAATGRPTFIGGAQIFTAVSFNSPQGVFDALLTSNPGLLNISPVVDLGVGAATSPSGNFWVVIFY